MALHPSQLQWQHSIRPCWQYTSLVTVHVTAAASCEGVHPINVWWSSGGRGSRDDDDDDDRIMKLSHKLDVNQIKKSSKLWRTESLNVTLQDPAIYTVCAEFIHACAFRRAVAPDVFTQQLRPLHLNIQWINI
jgi:hypothetical protein